MSWTDPRTWVTGEIVSASEMNTDVRDNMLAVTPAGVILPYGGSTAPSGWLLCEGAAVSRTTYDELDAVMSAAGYPFGNGDGSTTFNVPDMRGRMPLGKDNMGGTSANRVTASQADNVGQASGDQSGVGQHTHDVSGTADRFADPFNNFAVQSGAAVVGFAEGSIANAGSVGGNMPPYLTLNYVIKA